MCVNRLQIPFDNIPLNQWIAYQAPLPNNIPNEAPRRHIIIIAYRTGDIINYFHVTSKVDKARKRYEKDKDALVEVKREDWGNVLTQDLSCIQCGKGHLSCITEKTFRSLYENGEIEIIETIPDVLKERIKTAINASVTYNIIEQAQYTR